MASRHDEEEGEFYIQVFICIFIEFLIFVEYEPSGGFKPKSVNYQTFEGFFFNFNKFQSLK